jgi:hypothetical protein
MLEALFAAGCPSWLWVNKYSPHPSGRTSNHSFAFALTVALAFSRRVVPNF